MKRVLLLVTLVLALSSVGWAGACAPGTIASYEALGAAGCTLDGLLFSNFSGTAVGTVQVIPNNTLPGEFGLFFGVNLNAGAGASSTSAITYTVSCLGGGNCIGDLMLVMVGTATGTGTVSATETGGPLTPSVLGTAGFQFNSDKVSFAGVPSLTLTDTQTASGGVAGTASVGGIYTLVSAAAPEPASLALLGSALLGAGLLLRRKLGESTR